MAVDYTDSNKFKALASILEHYTEWFGNLALYVAYNDVEHIPENFVMPTSFIDWLEGSEINVELSPAVINPIVDMYKAMQEVSLDITNALRSGNKPNHKDFQEFKNIYNFFLTSIRRLEKDSAMKSDGTDDATGLRPSDAIKHDLDREMERLSRNGNPFALVVARIDNFEQSLDGQKALSIAADNIKRSMRPFDDAYYLDNGQFLLSLKHADMVGADAAISRIQQSLFADENNLEKVTLSCCMSEPVTGDEITVLIENMKNDLNLHADEDSSVLKFLDISPLERFIGTKK